MSHIDADQPEEAVIDPRTGLPSELSNTFTDKPEISYRAGGEIGIDELKEGVDMEPSPEESRADGHPTPDHPTGRIEP